MMSFSEDALHLMTLIPHPCTTHGVLVIYSYLWISVLWGRFLVIFSLPHGALVTPCYVSLDLNIVQ
jgi:hypothetical protein